MMELTQGTSGGIQITARILNNPLVVSTAYNSLQVTQSLESVCLRVHHTLVYYVNPWWTEFVTADGTFTLAEDKMLKVLTE